MHTMKEEGEKEVIDMRVKIKTLESNLEFAQVSKDLATSSYPNIAEEISQVRALNTQLNQENKDLNNELEAIRQAKCQECKHWKSQTTSLATKYFETIKGMKGELKTVRADAMHEIRQSKREIK